MVVAALVLSIGLHWAVLQSVAWAGMVVKYSQGTTLVQAITKTFDGKHPCALCKIVTEGKRGEKKQDVRKVKTRLEFCLLTKPVVPPPPAVLPPSHVSGSLGSNRPLTPPVPPPRAG